MSDSPELDHERFRIIEGLLREIVANTAPRALFASCGSNSPGVSGEPEPAATAREKEIAELRAKLEAVPVREMKAICEWELGLDFPCEAAATIDRWLAGLERK